MKTETELREHLLSQLTRLDKSDMTLQHNVINKCLYNMVKDKEHITLETLAAKCNQLYIVQDKARYGKIVPQRIQRAIGGTSRTSHPNEINNKLASSGWRLKLRKSGCLALYSDKTSQIELDLN